MEKTESFLRWVSIVMFTILAIFVTIPVLAMIQNATLRKMNPFTLTVLAAALLWLIVVRFLFQDFYVRGQLVGGVKRFYERILAHPLQRLYKILLQGLENLTARITLMALLILAIVGLLAATGALDNHALAYMQALFFRSTAQVSTNSPVTILSLTTPDNNRERYLELSLKAARDLKEAGAKVVMMDLPWVPLIEKNLKLVSEINNTGIVVFGTRFSSYDQYWRITQQPVLGKLDISWGQYTFPSEISSRFPGFLSLFYNPFIPYGSKDTRTGKIVPDVAVEVLRKFQGAADIQREGNVIVVGNLRLPVTNDGTLYSHYPRGSFPFWAGSFTTTDKTPEPMYSILTNTSRAVVGGTKTLKGYEENFMGKIVLLQWQEYNNPKSHLWSEIAAYSMFINNALKGKNILRKAERWPLYLTLLSVLFCGLITRYLRGLYSVPLMLLLGVGLFFSSQWLLHNQDILLDVSYPLAAVILSIAVFPLARFAYSMRSSEAPLTPTGFAPSLGFAPEPPTPMALASEITRQQPQRRLFTYTGKRLSLSFPLAALVIVLSIVGSATLTYVLLNSKLKPQTEVIYIPTLPTVEVQGNYLKSGN